MMDDDTYEPFEVNEFDMENAMNPYKRRRFTKQQQIYGMWADREDEDDDEDESDRRGGRRKKDYTAPMSFVSGGVKRGDKVEPILEEERNQKSDEDESPSISFTKKKTTSKKGSKYKKDDTAFAGMRSSSMTGYSASSSSQGGWEKHTRGIGAKLLSKMGYVPGKGLGKIGQGIVEPIQATLRPGRGAIGAYGPESKKTDGEKGGKIKTTVYESEEEEVEKDGQRMKRWRKDGGTTKTKQRYKTWEDVVADGGHLHKQLAGEHKSVKVIDMTGKEKKVFTGYEVFRYKTRDPESDAEDGDATESSQKMRAFDVPELRHNLDILVDMTEEAIVQNDRQLKFLKDQKVALEHDDKQLAENMEVEEHQMDRLAAVIALLQSFESRTDGNRLTLSECKELFKRLQRDFYEEYKMFGLSAVVVTNVVPLLKEYFARWQPLANPDYGCDVLDEWKSILEEDSSNYISLTSVGGSGNKLEQMHPYHRLLWDCVLPSIRCCALSWDPRNQCEEMVNLVNHWLPILPGWILENILEQIILPRLERDVENWNPVTDTTPIHVWLHPWLPLMGDRLQPVYAPIRHKLGRALAQWHPSDLSAKNVLKPWQEVFAFGAMQSFLSQHILPKLEVCLTEFQINPGDQDLRPWHWVMDWMDMLNPALLADSIVKHFFPKWHGTLIAWLNCRTANYDEISRWYSGWKSLFHSDLMAFQQIRDQFTHALEIMNHALSGGGVQPSVSYSPHSLADRQRAAAEMHQRHMEMMNARSAGQVAPSNFKDLLEKKAEEHGLLFIPVPNKFREGKPVYRLGSCQIYLDRNVVFLLQPSTGQWIPVSLEQLISSAVTG